VCSCVALAVGFMGMLFACLAPLAERGEFVHEPTGIVFPDPRRLDATRSRGPSELYDPPASFVAYRVEGGPNVAFRLRPVRSAAASAPERLRDETRRSAEQQEHAGWSVLPDEETTVELLGEARESRQFGLLPPDRAAAGWIGGGEVTCMLVDDWVVEISLAFDSEREVLHRAFLAKLLGSLQRRPPASSELNDGSST
jgi:hypothetical protein